MQAMIDFILNGETEFTASVLVGLIVFVMTLECIGSIAYNILKVGGRN